MLKEIITKLRMRKIALVCSMMIVAVAGSVIGIYQALNVKENSQETKNDGHSFAIKDKSDEIDVADDEKTDSQELTDEVETSEKANAATNEVEEKSTATTATANSVSDTNSNNSSTTNQTTSGSSTSGNTTTSPSTSISNSTTTTPTTAQTYEKFTEEIGVYVTKNLPSEDSYYEDRCPAWIGVYSVGKSETVNNGIRVKFRDTFGFDATAEVVCTFIGKYRVDGYAEAEDIYQYTIKDLTYPLLQDEFYVITKKICDDGSPWVGFATPDPYDSVIVQPLLNEMQNVFCEWSGYNSKYVFSNKDKFIVFGLSEAGWMRTKDGQVMRVLYRYFRGLNMPILQQ